jgi:two-component system response regulator MprA
VKVLVVDDEPDIRRVVRESLELHGHAVVEATCGVEALLAIRGEDLDVVVLDLLMPSETLDGFDVLREARKIPDAPPFVVMTAVGGTRNLEYARSLGAGQIISKPFRFEELIEAVENV